MVHKARGWLIAALIVAALSIAYFIFVFHYDSRLTDYGRKAEYLSTRGYARVLGLRGFDAKDIVKRFGVPVRQTRWIDPVYPERELVRDAYPAFDTISVTGEHSDGTIYKIVFLVVFKDESLRFGKMKIGIGSTKEEVHRAYAKDPIIEADELICSAHDYPDVDEGYFGEDWSKILFCYDEAGKVESMAYEAPAF